MYDRKRVRSHNDDRDRGPSQDKAQTVLDLAMDKLCGDLVERLDQLAELEPSRPLVTELLDGATESASLTAPTLLGRAAAVSIALRERGIGKDDVALLIASSPAELLCGLLGCLRSGVIAVPLAFPTRPDHLVTRLEPVRVNAGAVAVLAGTAHDEREQEVLELLTEGALPVVPANLAPIDPDVSPPCNSREVAYLQYTSGSTTDPKGVTVTHQNLIANLSGIARQFAYDSDTVVVNWNPLSHDMGLVMGALPAIAFGVCSVLMPPIAFLRRPMHWLRAIERYRGTDAFSPNFGYDLLVDRTSPEERATLDLSSMRSWVNGGEPVRSRTHDRFIQAFAVSGVKPVSWRPGYGLAEATVYVSSTPIDDPGLVVWVDAKALEEDRVALAAPNAPDARPLCSGGIVEPSYEAAIVDHRTKQRLASLCIGELWLRGPSVSPGYWKGEQETIDTFGATIAGDSDRPWLRTGDLAFFHGDQVVPCGRLKDVIVIAGRNLYPQDIELTAESAHDAIRPGGVAAFSIDDDGSEAIALLVEVNDPDDETVAAHVSGAVRRAIMSEYRARMVGIRFLGPRGVPKTSSGKVQRTASREIYLQVTPSTP
jgi:acyl-CoA synthetase (AMP-forming)/AMP-acid ligase II